MSGVSRSSTRGPSPSSDVIDLLTPDGRLLRVPARDWRRRFDREVDAFQQRQQPDRDTFDDLEDELAARYDAEMAEAVAVVPWTRVSPMFRPRCKKPNSGDCK